MLKRVVPLVRIVFLFAKEQNHCRQCILCFKHILFIRQKGKNIFSLSDIYTFMCVKIVVHPSFNAYLLRNWFESSFYLLQKD
jgi:hypothetical protein